jgi:3-oxoisoapionate decarboxylase
VPRRTTMGLTSDSFQSIRFASPQRLLEVDRLMQLAAMVGAAGAHGGMTQIDFEWARRTRALKEQLDMYVEVQTFLPRPDVDVFEHAVRVAKEAGASNLRVVCLLGRRYEMFSSLADWKTAVEGFHKQIADALPIAERHKMPLAIENHKDWRADEQVALMKRYDSEFLGVSLDTGNNVSILDDPMETVDALAPYTFNVHFKDIALEETEAGFVMSEVALGDGMLDLPRMVRVLQGTKPGVRFSLEMITRDPLEVPCLTDKYWSTFEFNGRALGRTLSSIRANKPRSPLPRITGLSNDERFALEKQLVDRSIEYARDVLGLK